MTAVNTLNTAAPISWRDYLELTKPRVVALMLLTAVVGMYLASPGWVPLPLLFFANLGIGLAAGSAAAINHLLDRQIDILMARTKNRPVATGRVPVSHAVMFAVIIGALGLGILAVFVNQLTAVLTFLTLVGYAGVYTVFLKRATSQNIVIGGAAGAAPPMLGWVAVTGHIDPNSLLLVLIIFTWTPPHFWALAIYRYADYAKADIPMLPVTHGIYFTKICIVLYTVLLLAVSALPFVTGMSGWIYFIAAMGLGLWFLVWSIRLLLTEEASTAMKTFRFSIIHLMWLFIFLLVDHYWLIT